MKKLSYSPDYKDKLIMSLRTKCLMRVHLICFAIIFRLPRI